MTDSEERDDTASAGEQAPEDRFAVLDVFGLKLEVSNPRLAELLTMDARSALKSDVKELVDKGQEATPEGSSVPEIAIAQPTPRDEHDAQARREFRAEVHRLGEDLGFSAAADGIWTSPTGLSILTRGIERPVSLATASHFVNEIAHRRESLAGPDSTALFVVEGQQTADVFKVAIRQRRMFDLMRTTSLENLHHVAAMVKTGRIGHREALVLLAPVTNIDIGEILSVIKATRLEAS